MKLEGTVVFKAALGDVWRSLMSPEALSACIPGCQSMELVGDGKYEFDVKMGVGSVTSTYRGSLTLRDVAQDESYHMDVEGRGRGGSVRAEALVAFKDLEGETQVDYSGEARVGGLVGWLGDRMLTGIADKALSGFFECMKRRVEGR